CVVTITATDSGGVVLPITNGAITLLPGTSITLTANPPTPEPNTYSWFKNFTPISDETNRSLLLKMPNDETDYTISVYNQNCGNLSATIRVKPLCPDPTLVPTLSAAR